MQGCPGISILSWSLLTSTSLHLVRNDATKSEIQNGVNRCVQCSQSNFFMIFQASSTRFFIYRRLFLSQSPADQTKYFEISVVWDSQSVTSFTICMYVALQLARKQSRTVELRNVTNSILFIHSKNVCDQWLFDPVLHAISSSICDTHLLAWQFLQHVGNVCCLQQRMPIRSVQSLKLQRCRYVPVGFNKM